MTVSPGYRTYTTATGFAIEYRALPPDFLPALRARVRADHEASRPPLPVVRLERAPGVWTEQPVDPTGDLPDDPDLRAAVEAYREQLSAWERITTQAITREVQQVLTRTVRFPINDALVAETRDLYALTGEPLTYDDRFVMLWYVILTDPADQSAVTLSLQGMNVEEAAQQARAMFRRIVEGATA